MLFSPQINDSSFYALLTLLAVIGQSKPLYAQREDLQFEFISVEQGLSNAQITSITQDSRGFLWVGTINGLNKYDGYSFTVFKNDPTDSTSLAASPITFLKEDRFKVLWVSTESGGLNRFNRAKNNFTRFTHDPNKPGSLSGDGVGPVYEDKHGTLWIGSNGVDKFDRATGTFRNYSHNPFDSSSLSSNFITFILEDRFDNFWVGTDQGLNLFDKATGRFTHYRHEQGNARSLSFDILWPACADTDGSLWIGTHGGGLNRFDPLTRQSTSFRYEPKNPFSLGNDKVSAIHRAHDGKLWIGTFEKGGLNVFDPHRPGNPVFVRYKLDRIRSVFEDRSGNIWVGSDRGLNKVSRVRAFKRYLPGIKIRSFYIDRRGFLWVGTMGFGIRVFDTARREVAAYHQDPNNKDSLRSGQVYCFCEDRLGNMWIGTWQGGLHKLDRKTGRFTRYRNPLADPSRLISDDIMSIHEDRSGMLKLLAGSGLMIFDPHKATFTLREPSGYVHRDAKGIYWTETSEGLMKIDEVENRRTLHKRDFQDLKDPGFLGIRTMFEDSSGNLWMGTGGNGLIKFDRVTARFTRYTMKDGLANDYIHGVLVDNQDNVWVATDNGLSRFDPKTNRFRNYDIGDGLPTNNFYYGDPCKSQDGELFFQTVDGAVSFHPEHIPINASPPPIVLTSFSTLHKPRRFERDISEVDAIDLSYREDVFTFEFAALDFTNPAKNQYAYKLEGFDEEWTYSGTRRQFTYTNLDPGTYIMRVKGSNSDGVWNEVGASVRLTIVPPFWLTSWFKVLVGLVLIGTVVFLYNWRVGKLLEIERTRTRIARDLHDELGSNLSGIALASQMLREGTNLTEQQRCKLLEISDNAVQTADAMREIIWFINPEHDEPGDIVLKMKDAASATLGRADFQFTADENVFADSSDLEFRRNVFLIFKEILNNIAKHARCSSVIIRIERQGGFLRMSVTDNGDGFDLQSVQQGNGLKNMMARAKVIGGTIALESSPRMGTRIILEAKMA